MHTPRNTVPRNGLPSSSIVHCLTSERRSSFYGEYFDYAAEYAELSKSQWLSTQGISLELRNLGAGSPGAVPRLEGKELVIDSPSTYSEEDIRGTCPASATDPTSCLDSDNYACVDGQYFRDGLL